jgi:hypothetical protein
LACLTTFAARKNSRTAGMDRGGWVGLPAVDPGLFLLVTMSSVAVITAPLPPADRLSVTGAGNTVARTVLSPGFDV